MRFFNTAGPVRPADHYRIPPLARFDLDEVLALVRMQKYFVLHAPRQTGKTSALLALRDLLNGQGYACVHTTVETAGTARDDVEQTMRTVLAGLGSQVRSTLGDELPARIWSGVLAESGPSEALRKALTRWSEASPKPLVLLIDEIDTLQGDPLLSTLPGSGQAPGVVPGLLPPPFGALAAPVRLRGDVAADPVAGVPAPGGERGRSHRAGVRVGPGPGGPADRAAASVSLRADLQYTARRRAVPGSATATLAHGSSHRTPSVMPPVHPRPTAAARRVVHRLIRRPMTPMLR